MPPIASAMRKQLYEQSDICKKNMKGNKNTQGI